MLCLLVKGVAWLERKARLTQHHRPNERICVSWDEMLLVLINHNCTTDDPSFTIGFGWNFNSLQFYFHFQFQPQ